MIKRLLQILFFACVCVTVLTVSALAGNIVDSGKCGENVIYTLDETGLLTISGTGAMDNNYRAKAFSAIKVDSLSAGAASGTAGRSPWFEKRSKIISVSICNGVTTISDWAFRDCGNLTSVTTSNSVTIIGKYAFIYCNSLTSIVIPDSVTAIGSCAFEFCQKLESLTIPDSITIGQSAFRDCNSLTNVTLADNTTVFDDAFYNCKNLKCVFISSGVTEISYRAFTRCPNVVLRVYENSYAHTYAVENEIPYEFINGEQPVNTIHAGVEQNVSVSGTTYETTVNFTTANLSTDKTYRIMYALYDENGQMVELSAADVTFDTGTTADLTIESLREGLTCRIFLLDGEIIPQCATTQLTFVNGETST